MATTKARAKVNLCLHVTGRRADGYHNLESVVGFADIGDTISVTRARETSLDMSGPYAADLSAGPDNLVLAAQALVAPDAQYHIHLEKNLPVASGIGGGSADAAAVIRLLVDEFGHAMPDTNRLMALGADVPVCVFGQASVMRGAGADITPLPDFPTLHAVLINPNKGVSTAVVFSRLNGQFGGGMSAGAAQLQTADAAVAWLGAQRNDLEPPAMRAEAAISDCLTALRANGAMLARMSGSGATCFGVFETAEQARGAAARISNDNPDWWVVATQLGGAG